MNEEIHVPEDSFVVAHGLSDGLPDILIINRALDDVRPKTAFPWHLSIIVDCQETTETGMPTPKESEVLADVGDAFDLNIKRSGNAAILARITWNHTRQYLYRVRNPETANTYLQQVIGDKSHLREFDYQMQSDPDWALAESYLELARRPPESGVD